MSFSLQGLAYSVRGGWNTTPFDHVGLFTAGGETAAPDKLLKALRTALEVGIIKYLISLCASSRLHAGLFTADGETQASDELLKALREALWVSPAMPASRATAVLKMR